MMRDCRLRDNILSHGAAWNTLISRYIAAIPVSGEPRPPEQSRLSSELSWLAESRARSAKVGVGASDRNRITDYSLSLFRKVASPASDTATHFGSGAAPGI